MKLLEKIVRAKVYVLRSLVYLSIFNSFMIFSLYIKSDNILLTIGGFILLVCLAVIFGYIEIKKLKLLEMEQSIFNANNKEQKYFIELLEQINKKLERE